MKDLSDNSVYSKELLNHLTNGPSGPFSEYRTGYPKEYPEMADLKVENITSNEKMKLDESIGLKGLYYTGSMLKVSNSKGFIFTTVKALKLMLHINYFDTFKFDMNNRYCKDTYDKLSRAITEFEGVRNIFCFVVVNDMKLRIKCLATNVIFSADLDKIDPIREYMKYTIISEKSKENKDSIKTPDYKAFRSLIYKYKEEDMLNSFKEYNADASEEVIKKCISVYRNLNVAHEPNPQRYLNISMYHRGDDYDEYMIEPAITISHSQVYSRSMGEVNVPFDISIMTLNDLINANIAQCSISRELMSFTIKKYVMEKYFRQQRVVDDCEEHIDMFYGLDDVGCENLINMLEK
ncbi:MAG: hypothetical protein Q4F66_03360 [Clostridium sp.]|nr:hypothetical protein [Clostridium sp.]